MKLFIAGVCCILVAWYPRVPLHEAQRPAPPVLTTTTTTTTTTTVLDKLWVSTTTAPPLMYNYTFGMYKRGSDVVELQKFLGMKQVDGIYGSRTRKAHMEYLGGAEAVLADWHPDLPTRFHDDKKTLRELVGIYWLDDHSEWALRVAFCESSAMPDDTHNDAVSDALAVGAFQILAKYWSFRSEAANVGGFSPFDLEANVATAADLFYNGGGSKHWSPSKKCWDQSGLAVTERIG